MMRAQPLKFAVWACAALIVAACQSSPEMDEQMRQDLQAASTSTLELAPSGPGMKVVSALEQSPRAQPKRQVSHKPTPERKAPAPKVADQTEPTATAPKTLPASSVSPPPPGGYKGLGDVIRNAPFPIKP